jgi:hypothetical protein
MSSSKKSTYKGTLRQMSICLRSRTPYTSPPPSHCIRVYKYSYSLREGGGGELNQREGERGNSSQSWVENTYMTDSISNLKTLINTCCKVPLQVNFLDGDILLWCLYSYLVHGRGRDNILLFSPNLFRFGFLHNT